MERFAQPTPSGFCKVAAVTWLIYDYSLTFNDELHHVWGRGWSPMKVLYIMIRYGTFPIVIYSAVTNMQSNVSDNGCTALSWVEAIGTFYIFAVVQAILQYRIYLMYHKSRKMLLTNIALLLTEIVISVVLAVFSLRSHEDVASSPFVLGSCFDKAGPPAVIAVTLPCLVFESYLLLLCVRKALQDHYERRRASKSAEVGEGIIAVLARDSVVYFALIVIAVLAVMILCILTPVTPGGSAVSFAHVADAVVGSRLVFSTRNAALPPSVANSSAPSSRTLTMPSFAFNPHLPGETSNFDEVQSYSLDTFRRNRSTHVEYDDEGNAR